MKEKSACCGQCEWGNSSKQASPAVASQALCKTPVLAVSSSIKSHRANKWLAHRVRATRFFMNGRSGLSDVDDAAAQQRARVYRPGVDLMHLHMICTSSTLVLCL